MKQFFKNAFSTVFGIFLFYIIFFFFITIIGGILFAKSVSKDVPNVKSNSVLKLDLSNISERSVEDFDFEIISSMNDNIGGSIGLNDILKSIENAKTDDKIKGISIENNFLQSGSSTIYEIRKAIKSFQQSGKFVYSYGDNYFQKGYYLSSVADSVFVNPMGFVDLRGLSAEVNLYKKAADKYGINFNVIRHGKYKSAVEPYLMEDEISSENRSQIKELLSSVWSEISKGIYTDRGIEMNDFDNIVNNFDGYNSDIALSKKLVDVISYSDEYEDFLKTKLGVDKDDKINYSKIQNYAKTVTHSSSKNKIAMLYITGAIMPGKGDFINKTGEKEIKKAIKKIKKNKNIKALVLRVNSPGGSAFTSDIIWREIELLKKKMPVVVSMGDVAASGGYYVAASADEIVAEPTTITGSIGVFGMIPTAEKLAKNIGINSSVVSTHDISHEGSMVTGINPKLKEKIKLSVENTYKRFLTVVSKGRKLPIEYVDSIAQGRVWSAKDALKNKLIDKIGTLNDAIEIAATKAKIQNDDYSVVEYPKIPDPMIMLLEGLKSKGFVKSKILREIMGDENYKLYNTIDKSNLKENRDYIKLIMPYKINL